MAQDLDVRARQVCERSPEPLFTGDIAAITSLRQDQSHVSVTIPPKQSPCVMTSCEKVHVEGWEIDSMHS